MPVNSFSLEAGIDLLAYELYGLPEEVIEIIESAPIWCKTIVIPEEERDVT